MENSIKWIQQVICGNVCMCASTNMCVITNDEKEAHEFERDQGEEYG